MLSWGPPGRSQASIFRDRDENLRKLLPGGKREPKILVVFANRQEDCDRLIRYLSRRVTNSPHNTYPIHAYCLEKPYEAHRCAHVVVDPDQRRLYKRAQEELTSSWVALSATSWNNSGGVRCSKLIPLTLPPFRGIVGNENGDVFNLKLFPITRHMIDRVRQWYHRTTAEIGHWTELHFSWPLRHGTRWLRRKVKDKIVWGTAVGLGRMAWFAKHGVPVTRKMFDRLPPGASKPLVPPADTALTGITRIEFQDLEWRRDEIIRSIETSSSRFVLFCPPGYVDTFEDFLPLFNDRSTFAVTRQSGYREWRPIMVTLSPFRILTPKEASQVAAPLAPVVLVDRQKLRKLDIPKTLVFGAAWLSLFWRAGAAGWRSYSVGGTGSVSQQHDYWLEEMLFVKHLYLNPELQRLAMSRPSCHAATSPSAPTSPGPIEPCRASWSSHRICPSPSRMAARVRIYNLCKSLADRVDFILICFREVTDSVDYEELHKLFRRVYVVDRDEITSDPALPKQVNHYETSGMRALIGSVAAEQGVELLQIEYTDLAAYREAAPQTPAVLVEHDITYMLHRQFAERDKSDAVVQEYDRWLKFETGRLRAFDSVFVMSAQDQDEAVASAPIRSAPT